MRPEISAKLVNVWVRRGFCLNKKGHLSRNKCPYLKENDS